MSNCNDKCCQDEEACGSNCDDCESKQGCSGGCCAAPEEIDLKELGKEAVEMGAMFDEVNDHLLKALKTRAKILDSLHNYAKTPELKEKMDKVLRSRHPVLLQFVLGMRQE
ncbi:MAG: hypothetical protein ACP5N9_02865 [Candidatus Bilamarchaeum sp.]